MLIESRHRQSICEFLCDKLKDKTKKNKKCKVIVIFTAVCVDVDLHFTCADFVFHFRRLGKCRLLVNVFLFTITNLLREPVVHMVWISLLIWMLLYVGGESVINCWNCCSQIGSATQSPCFFFDNINLNIEDEAMLKNQ